MPRIIVLLMLVFSLCCWAQGDSCFSIGSAVKNNPNSNTVKDFFNSLSDENCLINIDYNEWSNSITFSLLKEKPNVFFEVLFSDSSRYESVVYRILTNPVGDSEAFDCKKMKKAIVFDIEKNPAKNRITSFLDRVIDSQKVLGIFK
ncbi:MAG: hypothetical protein OCD01_05570 [Fibrobacterales bacterium]